MIEFVGLREDRLGSSVVEGPHGQVEVIELAQNRRVANGLGYLVGDRAVLETQALQRRKAAAVQDPLEIGDGRVRPVLVGPQPELELLEGRQIKLAETDRCGAVGAAGLDKDPLGSRAGTRR